MVGDNSNSDSNISGLLPRRMVIYWGACGMPPEYCEYGPDFETHCDLWLKKHHPELRQKLTTLRGDNLTDNNPQMAVKNNIDNKPPKPDHPWTTEERLKAFYNKYVPDKIEGIPALLEKYAGKEENLFEALAKKYGPEPLDPFFSDSEDEEEEDDSHEEDDVDDDEDEGKDAEKGVGTTKSSTTTTRTSKRRGVGANKNSNADTGFTGRVLVQKEAKKKKRILTVVTGLEPALAIHQHKLKDATKAFAKQFAGSSSVKDKDTIIVQGDHVLELAELLVDKFQVPEECIYIDMGDGKVMNLRG